MISNADKKSGSAAKKTSPTKATVAKTTVTKSTVTKSTVTKTAMAKTAVTKADSAKPSKPANATKVARVEPVSKAPAKKKEEKPAVVSSKSEVKAVPKKAKEAPKVAKAPVVAKTKVNPVVAKAAKAPVAPKVDAKKVATKAPVKKAESPKPAKPMAAKAVTSKAPAKPTKDVETKKDTKVNGSKVANKTSKVDAKGAPSRVSPPSKPVAKPKSPPSPPPKPTNPAVVKKIRELQSNKESKKDLAQDIVVPEVGFAGTQDIMHDPQRDRMVLVVRDSYWLQASWEITRRSVERARAAMAEHWHMVRPVLRLLKIDNSGTTNNSETILRDIEIHGGVRNWYIDVIDPPSSFRILLGYIGGSDRFYELVRSNVVTTPIPGSDEAISTHWAEIAKDAERIFALSGGYNDERDTKDLQDMFEDHLKRPMGAPALAQFGNGAESGVRRHRNFHFDLDAEMVVFGSTHPDAYVTLGGEPVKVQSDGTFSVRVPLPDRRQVLPATACTRDGVDEQTIVIAVERNTKVMEPLSKENEEAP